MQKAILAKFLHADIRVGIVWAHMLASDSSEAAEALSREIVETRVQHFHDPNRRAGMSIAMGLGGEGRAAWDTYLLYAKNDAWIGDPPAPAEWMHQLTSSRWADPARRFTGDALVSELSRCMRTLMDAVEDVDF